MFRPISWKNLLISPRKSNLCTNSFLSGINYYVGELKDISIIDFLKNDIKKLEHYYKIGLKTFSCSKYSMTLIAEKSIAKTLSETNIPPDQIDVLIYVAESSRREEITNSTKVIQLLKNLKLNNAYPIGLYLSSCANILMGVQIAHTLIKSGEAKNIMLVATDKPDQQTNSRIMNPEVGVRSDAAVSALVSSEPVGYKFLGTKNKKNKMALSGCDPLDFSIQKLQDIRHTSNELLNNLNLKSKDFSMALVNNYAAQSATLLETCGFKANIGYLKNIEKYSHCIAGDTFMALKDVEKTVSRNQKIFVMADGPYNVYALALEKMN